MHTTKPFSIVKLVLQVKALLKRIDSNTNENEIVYGDLTINQRLFSVHKGKTAIGLTKTEYALFIYLIQHKDDVVSREELLNKVWGFENYVESRVTDDVVRRIRKKLNDARSLVEIATIRGRGFQVKEN